MDAFYLDRASKQILDHLSGVNIFCFTLLVQGRRKGTGGGSLRELFARK